MKTYYFIFHKNIIFTIFDANKRILHTTKTFTSAQHKGENHTKEEIPRRGLFLKCGEENKKSHKFRERERDDEIVQAASEKNTTHAYMVYSTDNAYNSLLSLLRGEIFSLGQDSLNSDRLQHDQRSLIREGSVRCTQRTQKEKRESDSYNRYNYGNC